MEGRWFSPVGIYWANLQAVWSLVWRGRELRTACYILKGIHVMIDTCQNKVFLDQYHITGSSLELINVMCFLKLTADKVLVFDWIMGSLWVNLLKTVPVRQQASPTFHMGVHPPGCYRYDITTRSTQTLLSHRGLATFLG